MGNLFGLPCAGEVGPVMLDAAPLGAPEVIVQRVGAARFQLGIWIARGDQDASAGRREEQRNRSHDRTVSDVPNGTAVQQPTQVSSHDPQGLAAPSGGIGKPRLHRRAGLRLVDRNVKAVYVDQVGDVWVCEKRLPGVDATTEKRSDSGCCVERPVGALGARHVDRP